MVDMTETQDNLPRAGVVPYPEEPKDVTAAALARYLTAQAWRTWNVDAPRLLHEWEAAGLPATGPLRDAYVHACSAASAQYAAVYLLRNAEHADLSADRLAEEANLPYAGDVDWAINRLEAWLDEYRIDTARLLADGTEGDEESGE